MWDMMKALKGIKIESELADASRPPAEDSPGKRKLWHGIDRYDWETNAGERQKWAKDIFLDGMVANYSRGDAFKAISVHSDMGM